MLPRTEYEMTEHDLNEILDACKATPVMFLSGGTPMGSSPQENANTAWKRLGDKMGFDHMTVRPVSGKGQCHFTAVPNETPEAKAERAEREAKEKKAQRMAELQQAIVDAAEAHDSGEHSEVYAFLLNLCPLLESGKNYLLSRGITVETIEAFKVAQMPRQSILPKLLSKFGFELIHAAGLLTQKSTVEAPRIIFPWNSIIFPFWEGNKAVYLQARALAGTEQYGKWRNLNSQPKRIFNVDAITQTSKRPFAICEGVIDTLSAIELGYSAVGMMGWSAKLTPDQIRALRKKEVEILLYWDEKGEKGAQQLREELNQYGVVSIRKKLPSTTATDLNEYLKEKRGLRKNLANL